MKSSAHQSGNKPQRFQYRFSFFLVSCALSALLVLFLLVAYYLHVRSAESDQWVIHTNDVLNNIRDVNINTRGLEASNRGYAITKDPAFKKDYETAVHNLDLSIKNLYALTNNSTIQKKRVDALNQMVAEKIALIRSKINAMEAGKPTEIIPTRSMQLSRLIQAEIDKFQQSENQLLAERTDKHRKLSKQRLYVSIGSFLFVLSFLVFTIYKISSNISRRDKAETLAKKQEARYRILIERAGIALAIINQKKQIVFASHSFEHLTGFNKDEWQSIEASKIIPFELTELPEETAENQPNFFDKTIDFKLARKDGSEIWVSGKFFPVADDEEGAADWQMVLWNVDQEKRMKLELEHLETESREQQKLVQDIIDNIPLVVFIKDLEGRYRIINNKMLDVLKMPASELLGKTDKDLDLEESRLQQYMDTDAEVVRYKTTTSIEDELMVDAEKRFFWVTKLPLLDEHKEVKYICGIAADVTVFKEVEHKLIEAKDEAENAKTAQESFLANISHEIRTPMNGIIGMSNLLTETNLDNYQREYTESILESARNLLSLINDLLDISKIRSGKFKFESATFNIPEVIKKAVYPLQFKAVEKGIELNIIFEKDGAQNVLGDPLRLQQILINLINNALKFTSKGKVDVRVKADVLKNEEVMLHIAVADTGMGIQQDKLAEVFDSYAQSNFNIARLYGGTGLGLAIVKQLVEMQHGSVSVSSKYGEGSVFSFLIPYKLSHHIENGGAPVAKEDVITIEGIRVLVAEDNIINQKVVGYTLQNRGAIVTIVNNGKEALFALRKGNFDVVLMDMQMPEMDGYEATTFIRKEMESTIPIIAMTANAIKGESDKCFEAGVDGYISKPFSQQELMIEILRFTSGRDEKTLPQKKEVAQNEAPKNEILDLSYVKELAGNKKDYIQQVLSIFMENTPPGLKELERLIFETKNWDKVSKQAHFLKSSVTIVKIAGMHEKLQIIETLARQEKEPETIKQLLKEISSTFAQAEHLIREELAAIA